VKEENLLLHEILFFGNNVQFQKSNQKLLYVEGKERCRITLQ
jgi:hypothetical protein